MDRVPPDNEKIAAMLVQVADLLELRKANRYRIRSYRDAAAAVRESDRAVVELWQARGTEGLEAIRGVGPKLARVIAEALETGKLALLDRLEVEAASETPFVKVPGLDAETAARIHSALGIETLEDLELAAHDGRLEQVDGMDGQRVGEIRQAVERLVSRSSARRARRAELPTGDQPPVALILSIDKDYRAKAEAGQLERIAPRRFNPERKRWLPIMKTRRGGWAFTALFSNTARAHELGKTDDWVVVYYRPSARAEEDQCTVVTGGPGALRGKRIVRGREDECREHYSV